MNKARTIESFVCIAVLLTVLFVGVWQIKPAQATTIFSDGFESGDLSQWTGNTTEGSCTVSVGSTAYNGAYGANISKVGSDVGASIYKNLGSSYSTTNYRFYMNISATPTSGNTFEFARMYDTGSTTSALKLKWYNNAGTLTWQIQMKNDAGDSYTSNSTTPAIIANGWYCVELKRVAANGIGGATLYVNDVEVTSIANITTSATGNTNYVNINVYSGSSQAFMAYFDLAKVGTSHIGLFGGGDTYPTYSSYGPDGAMAQVGASLALYSHWDDNDGLSTYAIQHNNTGVDANTTGSFSGDFWANTTITLNATECAVRVKIFANDTINQWNSTSTFYIYAVNATGYEYETRGMFFHEAILNGVSNNWTAIGENLAHYNFTDVYVNWGSATKWQPYLVQGGVTNISATIDMFHSFGLRVHYVPLVLGDAAGNASWTTYRSNGTAYSWNCPSNPLYLAAVQSHMENVSTYNFDGIMLDYIRYDIDDQCYCNHCRDAFEAWLGSPVTNWTQYYPNEVNWTTYAEWRTIPVTNLVNNIRSWALAINPDLKFSAAVYTIFADNGASYWRRFIGQDVSSWIKTNALDTVAPMMYTQSPSAFEDELIFNVKYYSDKINVLPFIDIGRGITVANFSSEIGVVRSHGMRGFVLWRYGGIGDSSADANITDYLEELKTLGVPDSFEIYGKQATVLSSTSFSVEWYTNISTTAILEYNASDLFNYVWTPESGFNFWWITHVQGNLSINMTHSTYHKATLTGLTANATYYYRCTSFGSGNYTTLEYTINLSGETVTVTITSPTNTTYTSSSVSVSLSASGGTINTIWWNCKNGTSWIYGTNQTYTVPTSMTGFVDGASYTFYAWANNTDGNWDEETVMFTVLIIVVPYDWGSFWGDWWGLP